MVVGIIIAAGIAVGAAVGLWQFGEGVKKRQEEVGKAVAKSINWITLAMGVCIVLMVLLFFMTRSRIGIGPGGKVATVTGGGAPAPVAPAPGGK